MPAKPVKSRKWAVTGVCALLAAITWAVFGRTLGHEFVNYDDNAYVYENPNVVRGLSVKTIQWAFTHSDLYLWTPLTTISHMFDCQLYGLNPGGHHLTNVLLHIAAVIALFLVLQGMTGALWRSAFVAAVFAIHPLRAESVAWVAERKDVLSGLFFMLTLGAYVFYVRKRSVARYVPVALLFALGLMAKQMLVTLPCVLLLLDYWPLGRFAQTPGAARGRMPVFFCLLLEKLPLFALSAASCVADAPDREADSRAIVPVAHPLLLRHGNALVCYFVYIYQLFYPAKLAVLYPYPASGAGVAGARRACAAGGHFHRRIRVAGETAGITDRVVLVCGNDDACDRLCAAGKGGACRPVHLPAANRPLHRPGMDLRGRLCARARSPRDTRHCHGCGDCGAGSRRPHPDFLLGER